MSVDEKADLSEWRAALEAAPPSSIKDNEELDFLIYSRDWKKARDLVNGRSSEEMPFFGVGGPMVPRVCLEIAIAKYQGEHPETNGEFGAARNRLLKRVEEHSEDLAILAALSDVDAYLGRKQEAIQEAKRAVEKSQVSKDTILGPFLVSNLAVVYALTNEPDLAFQTLDVMIRTPGSLIGYGDLKLNPDWDLLRGDPRFDKLLAQLAPHD